MGYGAKSISDWAEEAHALAKSKGFYDDDSGKPLNQRDPIVQASRIALIHSEVSEALEAVRDGKLEMYRDDNGKPDGLIVELADIVIRCMDFAESLGLNLEQAIREKHSYNESRPHKHGRKSL